MDTLSIRGITATGYHGVLAWEKEAGQPFVVDLELGLDLRPAGASDTLADTVNYAALAQAVADDIGVGSLDLVEALAERVARLVLGFSERIDEVRVTVHKPRAPIPAAHGAVSVSIRRGREGLDDLAGVGDAGGAAGTAGAAGAEDPAPERQPAEARGADGARPTRAGGGDR